MSEVWLLSEGKRGLMPACSGSAFCVGGFCG